MKKPLKIGLIVIGSFVSLLILLAVVFLILVNTTYIEKNILPRVLTSLEKSGINVKYESLKPSWLSSISADNVSVRIENYNGLNADLKINKFRISYSFWKLLAKKLYVKELLIEDPILESSFSLKEFAAKDDEEPKSARELIESLAESFPLGALYSKIKIRNAAVGIHERDQSVSLGVITGDILIEPDLRVKGKSIFLKLDMDLSDKANHIYIKKGDIELSLKPDFKADIKGAMLKRFKGYEFDFPVIDLKFAANDLLLKKAKEKVVSLSSLSSSIRGGTDHEKINTVIVLDLSDILMNGLEKPVSLSSGTNILARIKERELTFDGYVKMAGFEAAKFKGDLYDNPEKLEGDMNLVLKYSSMFREYFPALTNMPLNALTVKNSIVFSSKHGSPSIFDVKDENDLLKEIFAQVEGKVSCDEDLPSDRIYAKCPGSFKKTLSTANEKLLFSLGGDFSELFSDFFKAKNLRAGLDIEMPFHIEELKNNELPDGIKIKTGLNADYIDSDYFKDKVNRKDIPVLSDDWRGSLEAVINSKSENLSFETNLENKDENIKFSLGGKSDFALKNTLLQGRGRLRPYYPKGEARSAKGSMSFPIKVVTIDRRTFDVSGEVIFDDFSLSNGIFTVADVNGSVPVREKIRMHENTKFSFVNIYTESPFNRADYISVNPYLAQDRRFALKIGRVQKDNAILGPIYTDILLDQNMLKAEYFHVRLFDGDLDGNFFFDVRKGSEQIGFIGKLTGIKPKMILDQAALNDGTAKRVSGQMDVIYQINSSFVSGRMDINEIGSQQLIDLVNAVDPKWENSNLVSLRKALKIAYPTYVGMKMDRGYFDLTVRMPVLALLKGKGELSFRGLPLTPIVSIYSEELKNAVSKSPLQ